MTAEGLWGRSARQYAIMPAPHRAVCIGLFVLFASALAAPAGASNGDCSAFESKVSLASFLWKALSIHDFQKQQPLVTVDRAMFDAEMADAARDLPACEGSPSSGKYYELHMSRQTFDINTFRTPFTMQAVRSAQADLKTLYDMRYNDTTEGDITFYLLQHNIAQYYACMGKPFENYAPPPKMLIILRGKITEPCHVAAGMLKPA